MNNIFFFVLIVSIFTFAKAAYDQPLRNQLSFSAEFKKTGRVLAAFSSSPGTLNVCYELEGENGWALAESNDGHTWKQVSDNVLPLAGDGDIVASTLLPQFSYLVAYDTRDERIVIGGAKSSQFEGFVKLMEMDGKSPTLFQIGDGIQYLGLINPIWNEVNFFRVTATSNGDIQTEPAATFGFRLPAGKLRSLQVFCFDSHSTNCVLSYSANTDKTWFRPYYIVGKFESVDSNLKFEPYIKNKVCKYLMDGGQSASDFRWVNISDNNVLAIGWNSRYQIPPVTPGFGNGFTIARKMTYLYSMIIQTPVDFLTKVKTKENLVSEDTILTTAGITEKLGGKDALLLDLFFFSPHDFEESGYQIDFVGTQNRTFSAFFKPTLGNPSEEMLMNSGMRTALMPWNFPQYLNTSVSVECSPVESAKIYIDKTTITISLNDGLGVVTQSYYLGNDSQFTSFVISPIGEKDVILKAESSVTQLNSIWSS